MTHLDRFWKYFWLSILAILVVYILLVGVLTYTYAPAPSADAAAVGVDFDPERDPFARDSRNNERPPFTSEYFYQDSLPLSLDDWSWGTTVDWNAKDNVFEGAQSIKATFREEWAGVRLASSDISTDAYAGISLHVYPNASVGDLFIELYDTYGRSMGRQSIGWYVPGAKLTPNSWNTISIPFENLMPIGSSKRKITGLSINTERPGIVWIDSIQLEKNSSSYPRWIAPTWTEPVEIPATPIDLPYTLKLLPEDIALWRTVFGRFDLTNSGVYVGPVSEKTNGAMSYLAGGKAWRNYRADTTLFWGPPESFSILVRYADDANFVSCAFGLYGQQVQIYQVQNGESTLMGSSPLLSVSSYEPWKDARHGAQVNENKVSCILNGEVVLSADIPNMPEKGTVGFETWTRNSYDAPHRIESLIVTSL